VLVDAQGRPLCVVTVHAHPDDEASKGAPTMAMYGAAGVRTVLVCCTGGEEGDVNNAQLTEPGAPFHGLDAEKSRALLAETRVRELAESVRIIGFHAHHMLGYRDSGMAGSASNDHPECFHRADLDEATGRLVALIRAERPQVLVTYNDDQRGYPHPDHVQVHEVSVRAFARAGDPAWYPEAGEPWAPAKMYYSMWSRARILAVHEALLARCGSSPYDEEWFARPDMDHRITTRLHVGDWLWARSGALRAHATQVDEREPFWFGLSDDELAEVWPYEDFVLAESRVAHRRAPGTLEDDLFAGLRP
jgi:mycothiol S-conjugate amidase